MIGNLVDPKTSPAWQKALADMEATAKRIAAKYQPARPLTGHWTDAAVPLVPREELQASPADMDDDIPF